MKTIRQALIDEIYYPINPGLVDNKLIKRGLDGDAFFTTDVSKSVGYNGVLADCLYSLLQAINFSESDKSIGNLTDEQRKMILKRANALYNEIGEPVADDGEPMVFFGG